MYKQHLALKNNNNRYAIKQTKPNILIHVYKLGFDIKLYHSNDMARCETYIRMFITYIHRT